MADLLAEVKDLIAAGVDPTVAANTVNAERARRAQQDDAGSTRSQLLLSAQRDFLFLFQSSVAGEVSGTTRKFRDCLAVSFIAFAALLPQQANLAA
jgi:hypothetical protein